MAFGKKIETPNPEPQAGKVDLTTLFKKHEGKGAFYYISKEEVRITATQIGLIGKKLQDRIKANRPVKDMGDFLLTYFPEKLVDELEALSISLDEAYAYLRKVPGAKTNYSKKQSEGERLARLVAGVSGSKSPEEMFEELLGLITSHRKAAEEILEGWSKTNGRSAKGGFILVNAPKTK